MLKIQEEEQKERIIITSKLHRKKRERKAQRLRRLLPIEKESTELKLDKCEDRKKLLGIVPNLGPQSP